MTGVMRFLLVVMACGFTLSSALAESDRSKLGENSRRSQQRNGSKRITEPKTKNRRAIIGRAEARIGSPMFGRVFPSQENSASRRRIRGRNLRRYIRRRSFEDVFDSRHLSASPAGSDDDVLFLEPISRRDSEEDFLDLGFSWKNLFAGSSSGGKTVGPMIGPVAIPSLRKKLYIRLMEPPENDDHHVVVHLIERGRKPPPKVYNSKFYHETPPPFPLLGGKEASLGFAALSHFHQHTPPPVFTNEAVPPTEKWQHHEQEINARFVAEQRGVHGHPMVRHHWPEASITMEQQNLQNLVPAQQGIHQLPVAQNSVENSRDLPIFPPLSNTTTKMALQARGELARVKDNSRSRKNVEAVPDVQDVHQAASFGVPEFVGNPVAAWQSRPSLRDKRRLEAPFVRKNVDDYPDFMREVAPPDLGSRSFDVPYISTENGTRVGGKSSKMKTSGDILGATTKSSGDATSTPKTRSYASTTRTKTKTTRPKKVEGDADLFSTTPNIFSKETSDFEAKKLTAGVNRSKFAEKARSARNQ